MSVVVDVGLISGKKVSVEATLDEPVKRRAQTALAVGKGRLEDASGGLLDDELTVKKAMLETGTSLTLQLGRVQIIASPRAFAAILGDGSVVAWGAEYCGGKSCAVLDQLKGVQQIQASERAFAAILTDGSVVTWGNKYLGGDSRAVQDQLKGVQQIQASYGAFAAILTDGSVVTWGKEDWCRQSCCARSAERRAADPSLKWCFCSYPDRRIGCYVGRRRLQWRPLVLCKIS